MNTFKTIEMIQELLKHLGQELQQEMEGEVTQSQENQRIYQNALDRCENMRASFSDMWEIFDEMDVEFA